MAMMKAVDDAVRVDGFDNGVGATKMMVCVCVCVCACMIACHER